MLNHKNAVKVDNISVNMTSKGYEGIGKQGMLFHQACFELCDNAFASAPDDTTARIVISLAPDTDSNYIWMAIADWGPGMNKEILDDALQMGSKSVGNHPLHEHGFGLKNALACLADDDNWTLYTRQSPNQNYLQVFGPYDSDMPLYESSALELPDGINLKWASPSTVILIRVPMRVVRTIQNRKCDTMTDLVTVRSWLVEHLGVTYRGYLEQNPATMEPYAKILITIGKKEMFVPPLMVPMMLVKTERFEVEMNGIVVPLVYTHGLLDTDARDHLVCNKKSKYYYLHNQPSQGIDIRLGKRVICHSQLSQIWFNKDGNALNRHNDYNDFVGELMIPELPRGVLSTLNNKTDINRADENWSTIFNAMQQFPPPKKALSLEESAVKKRWTDTLSAACPGDIISRETAVWCTGTHIDVLVENKNKLVVYEVKVRKAAPLDLYQLLMYWDGLVMEGQQPTEGILLANSFSPNMESMLKKMNGMPAPYLPDGTPSAPYNLKLATLEEKHLI